VRDGTARDSVRAGTVQPGRAGHVSYVVCLACRKHRHEDCPGGSWCDCQHLPPDRPAEPPQGWIRRG
ncbi:MAG TPA: hypothetical protein VFX25_17070, partial [Streptosporangiaceae bacterium]|nr:hypothetical protein [Streptosporangiaceae bacterium]